MSHNPNRGVAGVGGPLGLALELFRVVSVLRWTRCRDDLIQFFLMVELFDTNANVNTREARAKYHQYTARVREYCETVTNIRETSSEEEALSFMEAARDQMKVVMENVGLDPRMDRKIRPHWEKAEESKKKYKEIPSPQSTTTLQNKGDPICFSIGISFGARKLEPDENRELGMIIDLFELGPALRVIVACNHVPAAFSTLFEDWYLSALLSYTLAHPGKLGRKVSSSNHKVPIRRQAMDSIYLRSIDSVNKTRTRWAPIDYHDRMTVKECKTKMKDKPATQIRFISCTTRFVLVAVYDRSKNSVVEKIIDLDKEGKQLREALKRRELLNIVSSTAAQSVIGKGNERAHAYFQHDDVHTPLPEDTGKSVKFDSKKAFKALEPRSCLLLLGPDPFSAQSIKKP
ncbi:hypothetical protein M407DRAFT_12605 [Tulasnella calospora MUT 4182]|uniref:Uncharacterized protein n=1 Tax=Tulasnella calospora MUT 4182 TaxID=1051891 RepID=A0A0C3K690_9AGAM|nr:hypothetical protein M407DRAFT_12605 [Tulasnella calospora MUT 4182]